MASAKKSLKRLSVEADKAASGAEAAKERVRSAKADLKIARKLSKTAKKVAKLARKKVAAAEAARAALQSSRSKVPRNAAPAARLGQSTGLISKATASKDNANKRTAPKGIARKGPSRQRSAPKAVAAARAKGLHSASQVAKAVISRISRANQSTTATPAAGDAPLQPVARFPAVGSSADDAATQAFPGETAQHAVPEPR